MASDSSEGIAGAVATPTADPAPAPPPMLKLYSFWRSSCSQRVRIALNLKGLEYEYRPVNLLANEQSDPDFEKLNPIKYVPALVDGDTVVADSFAILLYLEDKYPDQPLLPQDPVKKALNIQIASIVGSSIQPLQNYPVLNFIEDKFDFQETTKWTQHHINRGFTALEKLLKGCTTKYATGDEVQLVTSSWNPRYTAVLSASGLICQITLHWQGSMKPTWNTLHFKPRYRRSNQMHLPPEDQSIYLYLHTPLAYSENICSVLAPDLHVVVKCAGTTFDTKCKQG